MSEKNYKLFRYIEGGKKAFKWGALSRAARAKLRRRLFKARARVFLQAQRYQAPEVYVDGRRGSIPPDALDITHFNRRGYPALGEIRLPDGRGMFAEFKSGMWHATKEIESESQNRT